MATTRLANTMGTPTLGTKFTYSCWVKRSGLLAPSTMTSAWVDGNNHIVLRFDLQDNLSFYIYNSGSFPLELETNAVFRDVSAWYHIVAKVDTTQATSSNRCKLYVNGTEQTSLSTATYPSQDATFNANASGSTNYVGGRGDSTAYFDGSMTHVHFTDGYAYDASTFGETDSTSGIWKPKAAPSVTYGTNGFFLKFENSGNLDLDSSSNNRSFSTTGTITQNVDTPTNNFATLNPLYTIEYKSELDMTNGNTTANLHATQWNTVPCTMAVSSGKWYFEGYGHTNSSNYVHYGITSQDKMNANATQPESEIQTNSNGYAIGYYGYNGNRYYSTTSTDTSGSYGSSYGSSDYIGIFMDLDNNKLYFSKKGTLQNSGTGLDINADGKPYLLTIAVYDGLTNVNFGNGVFGSTKLTGTTYADANGVGIFKYSPNQGGASNFDSSAKNFYALCTDNIKEFG